jgi:hypothetical protein
MHLMSFLPTDPNSNKTLNVKKFNNYYKDNKFCLGKFRFHNGRKK